MIGYREGTDMILGEKRGSRDRAHVVESGGVDDVETYFRELEDGVAAKRSHRKTEDSRRGVVYSWRGMGWARTQ